MRSFLAVPIIGFIIFHAFFAGFWIDDADALRAAKAKPGEIASVVDRHRTFTGFQGCRGFNAAFTLAIHTGQTERREVVCCHWPGSCVPEAQVRIAPAAGL